MKYNPNIHQKRSVRLKEYDYSQEGLYYITICTQKHLCLFGIIEKGEIILNKYGIIAKNEWLKTQEMRPNIHLDVFVIMPNHIHGIIEIADRRGTMHCAPTSKHRTNIVEQFGKPTSNTVPTIIRGYKSSVTKQINIIRNQPRISVWHRNYYDHIIRNENDLNQIREYIIYNPLNWDSDEENPTNLKIQKDLKS